MIHVQPQTVIDVGTAIIALAGVVLHFAKRWTIAAKAATWVEEHGQEVETVLAGIASSTSTSSSAAK